MPTAETTEPAGGRVTRSLRKRLTSIDGDVSSRPGTPTNNNLQTIPETNTPKKRITRRASLSTPSTATPSKEPTTTPGRRLTRRRSVNVSESEDQTVQTISREPTITAVKEEESEVETPKDSPKRMLRSSSKSPNGPEISNINKSLTKPTINKEKEAEAKEEEVITLDDTIESPMLKTASATKKARVSIKKEELVTEAGNKLTVENLTELNMSDSDSKKTSKRLSGIGMLTPTKPSPKQDSKKPKNTPQQSNSNEEINSTKEEKSAQKKKSKDSETESLMFEKIDEPQEMSSGKKKKLNKSIESGIVKISPLRKIPQSPTKNSPLKTQKHPEPLKNVAFNQEADEDVVKSVYPKTPGLIKSKSYILDASNEVDNDETFKSKKDQSLGEAHDGENKSDQEDLEVKDEETVDGLSTKTPHKLKLGAVQSSTPIQNKSPKQNKTAEIKEKKNKSAKETLLSESEDDEPSANLGKSLNASVQKSSPKQRKTSIIEEPKDSESEKEKASESEDDEPSANLGKSRNASVQKSSPKQRKTSIIEDPKDSESEKEKAPVFPKTWTKFVSGTLGDTSKIDRIVSEKSLQEQKAQDATNKSQINASSNSNKSKSIQHDSDYSEADDDMLEEDDDELGDDEEREGNAVKTVFLDDEAMEVAEGEESMDSEERAYLEENEVPEYGESIGSQDTEEEEDGDDEPDEDDAAFVVSDNEVTDELLSSEDEVEISKKKKLDTSKQTKYKRILTTESSDEEGTNSNNKNDTDLCLMVDSSFEEEKTETDNVKSPNKSLKNKSIKDKSITENSELNNSKVNKESPKAEIPNEKDISMKSVGRKSGVKDDVSIVDKPNSSKLNQSVENNDSDVDMTEEEGATDTQTSKTEAVSQKNEKHSNALKKSPENKLNKSPKRKSLSIIGADNCESNSETLLNQSRKSYDGSENVEDCKGSDNLLNESKSSSKTRKRSIKMSAVSDEGDDNDSKNVEQASPRKLSEKKVTKSPKRQSLTIVPAQDESEDDKLGNSMKQSRKSVNKSLVCDDGFESANEKSLNESRNSANKKVDPATSEEKLNVSRRKSKENLDSNKNVSVNKESEKTEGVEKRKSLVRTSTEETNEADIQSTLEKTKLSQEDGSEPEETLSASENPLDSSVGKMFNTSKKLRKSVDRNHLLEREQFNDSEKSKRRKSIVQQSTIQDGSESSSDAQEEKTKQDSNNRRKSIGQHSVAKKAPEISNDSEDEITDNELESSINDAIEAQFSAEEDIVKDGADFLEEEDKNKSFKKNTSRRKSVGNNESKLDETFQLDPKTSLSSSLHESLHRSILRKSLNQSQKRKENTEENTDDKDEDDNISCDSEEEDKSSVEEKVQIKQKIMSERGLSVSLNSIQIKKKKLNDARNVRNSFTIGVSIRKNDSENEDASDSISAAENKFSSEGEDLSDNQDSISSSENKLNVSEEEVLEKVKDVQHVGPYKSRKSMSNSILLAPPSDTDITQKKRTKRTSLYLQDEEASNSFVENLVQEKKKLKQQKRRSNSFCGVIAPPSADENDDVQPKEPRSEKKLKKSYDSDEKHDKVKTVLSRCEEMIEAANEAKRIAKMQAKKVKVKKPKWMDKEEKITKESDEVVIPLVSRKEIKRKEKLKKEVAKALKQSASVLSKTVEPGTKAKQKNPSMFDNVNVNPAKRLEKEFLDSLVQLSNPNKKKTKEIETTPPSDKENSKKKSNKIKYKIEDVPKKIKSHIKTLETACGTVIVEPSTPQKLRVQYGFHESPKTPVGFKIQNINSNDKKTEKKNSIKFKTTSGSFVEEDLDKSKDTKLNKQKALKRKLQIKEPTYTLPKTQWTTSGFFVEEDLSNPRPLANSTATQFLVASLSTSKKSRTSADVLSSTTMNNALSFKNNALKKDKVRQKSREIIHAKQRKMINSKF